MRTLYSIRLIFDTAVRGALITAGGALAVFTLAATFDLMRQPPTERLLAVLFNYFLAGAVLGTLWGLLTLAWRWWQTRR